MPHPISNLTTEEIRALALKSADTLGRRITA